MIIWKWGYRRRYIEAAPNGQLVQDIAHPTKIGGLVGGFLLHPELHALVFCLYALDVYLLPLNHLSHIGDGWVHKSHSGRLRRAHSTTITSRLCFNYTLDGLPIQGAFRLEHLLTGSAQANCNYQLNNQSQMWKAEGEVMGHMSDVRCDPLANIN